MSEESPKPSSTNRYFEPLALLVSLFALAALFNFRALMQEKEIVLIRAEKPFRANFTPSIAQNARFQQGQSLEVLAETAPAEGHFSILYRFRVLKTDAYGFFFAGTPPGADRPSRDAEWFSPYAIAVDGGPFLRLSEDSLKKAFPAHPADTEYVRGGYHWSRVAFMNLTEGVHTLEVRISEKRLRDGKYAFYLDSILLVPRNFKPKRLLKDLDPRFFS
jgi:hypothetical protein